MVNKRQGFIERLLISKEHQVESVNTRFSVTLDVLNNKKLDSISEEFGVSKATIINSAIEDFISDFEEELISSGEPQKYDYVKKFFKENK